MSNGAINLHIHCCYNNNSQSPTHTSDTVGDFYITQHSNLSQVHVVFHLVTDDQAVQNAALKARHVVLQGLKNCLRTAARHDIHHITVPLLLVHTMQPVSLQWCAGVAA